VIATAQISDDAQGNFARAFRVLSSGIIALALVALARHAVGWKLSGPMRTVMDAYNVAVQTLLGWAEPHLHAALVRVGNAFGSQLVLSPSWRDAFVMTALVLTALISGRQLSIQRWLLLTSFAAVGALVSAMVLGVILGGTSYGLMYVVAWSLPFALAILLTSGDEDSLLFETIWALLWVGVACGVVGYLKGKEMLVTALPANAGSTVIIFALTLAMLGVLAVVFAVGAAWTGDPRGERQQSAAGLTILGGFAGAALFFAADAGIRLFVS
jgi:hypothetical protein